MTSVKEIRVEEPATPDSPGLGRFRFTDDYSVFDWGGMPDPIPAKGASLCAMGARSFEALEAAGIPTHYRGVAVGADDAAGTDDDVVATDPVSIDAVAGPPREMAIDLAQVPALPRDGREYDYDAYHAAGGDCVLVPLEIVFRNAVPVGSSLRRRTDPADHGLDLDSWPGEDVSLAEPVVEFSTKLESSDRYLDREEASRLAGKADLDDLEAVAREVDRVVTDLAADAGLTHQDGKIECIYVDGAATAADGERADAPANGGVRVADVVGTLDENRFGYRGQQLSKEVLRQFYRRTQPAWVDAVADAKVEAKARGIADWKALCEVEPEPLPPEVVGVASDVYAAAANAYVGRGLFDAPGLEEAVAAVREL